MPEVPEQQIESIPARPPNPYQALEAYRNIDDIKKKHEEGKEPLLEQLRLEKAKVPQNKEEIQRISTELREKSRAYSRYQKDLERRALYLEKVILSITQDVLRASPHNEMRNLGDDLGADMFKKERAITFNGDFEELKTRLANVQSIRAVLEEVPFDRSPLDDKIRRSARAIVEEYRKKPINAFSLDLFKQVLEEFKDEIVIRDEKWPACEQAINTVLQRSLPDDQAKQEIYFKLQRMITYQGPRKKRADFFDPIDAAFAIRECVEWSLKEIEDNVPILEKGTQGKKERKRYAKQFVEYLWGSSAILEEEEGPEQNAAQVIEQFKKEAEELLQKDHSFEERRSLLAIQIENYLSKATKSLDSDILSWDEEETLKGLLGILKAPVDRAIQDKRHKLGLPIVAGLALAAALGGAGIFLERGGFQPENQAAPTLPDALPSATPDCPLPESFSLTVEKAGKPKKPLTWVYALASLPPGYGAWELDPHTAHGQLIVTCPKLDAQGNPIGTLETVYSWEASGPSPSSPPERSKPLARVKKDDDGNGDFEVIDP